MSIRHISAQEMERLRAGALTPPEAARVLEHRATCAACRLVGGPHRDPAVLGALLDFETCPARSENGEQTLVDYVAGRLDAEPAAQVSRHFPSCRQCSAIIEELRLDLASMNVGPARELPWRPRRIAWQRASAAVLVIGLAGAIWLAFQSRQPVDHIEDGGVLMTLNRSSEWNIPLADSADRALVLNTLRSRRLPPAIEALHPPEAGYLRGADSAPLFRQISPLYTRVEQARPPFSWTAMDGVRVYRVTVFRLNGSVVVMSPALDAHHLSWTPDQDLPRGIKLGWQVTAERPGEDPVLVPAPPAPPAIFEVLDAELSARIERARALNPPGHLLAAAIYAQQGMKSKALAEIQALQAANPQSSVARELLQSLR